MEYFSVNLYFSTKYHPITTFLFYVSDHNDPDNNLNYSPHDGKLPIKRRFYTQLINSSVLFLIKQVPGCSTQPQLSGNEIYTLITDPLEPMRLSTLKTDLLFPYEKLVPFVHHYPSFPLDQIIPIILKDDLRMSLYQTPSHIYKPTLYTDLKLPKTCTPSLFDIFLTQKIVPTYFSNQSIIISLEISSNLIRPTASINYTNNKDDLYNSKSQTQSPLTHAHKSTTPLLEPQLGHNFFENLFKFVISYQSSKLTSEHLLTHVHRWKEYLSFFPATFMNNIEQLLIIIHCRKEFLSFFPATTSTSFVYVIKLVFYPIKHYYSPAPPLATLNPLNLSHLSYQSHTRYPDQSHNV